MFNNLKELIADYIKFKKNIMAIAENSEKMTKEITETSKNLTTTCQTLNSVLLKVEKHIDIIDAQIAIIESQIKQLFIQQDNIPWWRKLLRRLI